MTGKLVSPCVIVSAALPIATEPTMLHRVLLVAGGHTPSNTLCDTLSHGFVAAGSDAGRPRGSSARRVGPRPAAGPKGCIGERRHPCHRLRRCGLRCFDHLNADIGRPLRLLLLLLLRLCDIHLACGLMVHHVL